MARRLRVVRRRRVKGFISKLGRALIAFGQWGWRHPQPAALVAALFMASWGLAMFAKRTDAFRIERVELPSQVSEHVRERLLGKNLWAVDIGALAAQLKVQTPWLKDIRVIRQLPHTLRVEVVERHPVAQVRLGEWHAVDAEGFVMPQGQHRPDKRLVQVVGLNPGGPGLAVGRVNSHPRLQLALRVLEQLVQAPAVDAQYITQLDVNDPRQIRFRLDAAALPSGVPVPAGRTIEVRCGSEPELSVHLQRLSDAMRVLGAQPVSIRYIDLRFQDPVVGKRT